MSARRRAWWYYQQGPSGKWGPVIRWDEPPLSANGFLVVGQVSGPAITEPVELTDDDFILTEPEDFIALSKRYPRKEPSE